MALLLILVACQSDGDPGDRGDGTALRIDSVPTLSLGVLEGDTLEQFDRVVTPHLSDGDVVIPDAGSSSIRVFSSDGDFLEAVGRSGEGPGEFVTLRSVWSDAGTIEAWDMSTRRITRFRPGDRPEVVSVSPTSAFLDNGLGRIDGGWVLVSTAFGEGRDQMTAELIDPDGQHRRSIVQIEGMARHEVGGSIGPHPVTPTAVFDLHDGELYAAQTDSSSIGVYGATGQLLRRVPLPLEPAGEPGAVLEEVIDSAVARAAEDRKESARQRFESFPEPGALPLFWDFIVDQDGLVWVRPYDPLEHALPLGGRPGGHAGPGGEWVVLSQSGEEVARVAMPEGFEPVEIRSDAILGVRQDQFGVEYVEIYPVRR